MIEGGSRRGEEGYTLIEVIIAIVLLSSVFLAFAAAIFTVSRATATNKSVQAIDTALVSYAQILRSTDLLDYVPCSDTDDGTLPNTNADAVADAYEAAAEDAAVTSTSGEPGDDEAWRKPDNMIIEIVGVDSWNADTKQFDANCVVPDKGGQRIRYEASIGTTKRSGETVKRYPGPSA